ncbi:MAG: tetratricopeptide repeat protein, partial [Nitrospiraceae bacterium]
GDKAYLEHAKHQLEESGEGNPSALNNLGIVCMLQGNLRVALGHFKKALSIEPRSAKTHFNIATCYVKERNYEKAVRHFVSSLSLDKQNVEAAKGLARVYLLASKYPQAVELLSEWSSTEDAQLLEILGEALFYSKSYGACLKCLLRAQKLFEGSKTRSADLIRVYNNLGCAYLELGNREEAGAFFKKSARESPHVMTDAHCNLFALYMGDNRFEEAFPLIQIIEKDASKALKSPAWQARFNFLAARYYLYQKDYSVSSRYLAEAKHIDPTSPTAYIGISYILSEIKGDYLGAIEILKQGLSHTPTNLMLLNNLAYNYLMKGNIENARGVLDRINEQDALENPHLYATRGLLLVKEGALEEGARLYNQASILAKDEETRAQVRQKKNLEMGRYFLSQGKLERAKKLLKEVFSIDSRSDLYKEQAASLLKDY